MTDKLSDVDRNYLEDIGFRLPTHPPHKSVEQSGEGSLAAPRRDQEGHGSRGSPTALGVNGDMAQSRTFVHACCETGSLLSRPTVSSIGCKMVDITKEDDFTDKHGTDMAIKGIIGPRDTLFFSSPCTGGSPWQRINLLRGGDRMLVKLKGHWKLFKQLWASFEIVAAHAISVGARIFVEWPRGCAYWGDKGF